MIDLMCDCPLLLRLCKCIIFISFLTTPLSLIHTKTHTHKHTHKPETINTFNVPKSV